MKEIFNFLGKVLISMIITVIVTNLLSMVLSRDYVMMYSGITYAVCVYEIVLVKSIRL